MLKTGLCSCHRNHWSPIPFLFSNMILYYINTRFSALESIFFNIPDVPEDIRRDFY
jgi:hypothetical protein